MKLPLQYQISEFDCGPSSLRNAMAYLFDRDQLPQEILTSIFNLSLDGYHAHGTKKSVNIYGTSDDAMMSFSKQFNEISARDHLSYRSKVLLDSAVDTRNPDFSGPLKNGGAIVAKVMLDVAHYVLITCYDQGKVRLFDPYMPETPYVYPGVKWTMNHPYWYNVETDEEYLNRVDTEWWSFGEVPERIALTFTKK